MSNSFATDVGICHEHIEQWWHQELDQSPACQGINWYQLHQ